MRWIYSFGSGTAEGGRDDRDLLGSKGAQLAEMTRMGLNVPPGFTITTEACRAYLSRGEPPPDLWNELDAAIALLEDGTGRRFGDTEEEPLLVSVRSGAAISMPGMMDTILNLGSNDATANALARSSDNDRFAWDCYRRFVQMHGEVVCGVDHAWFEDALEECRRSRGVAADSALPCEDLERLVADFKAHVEEVTGRAFPSDPDVQLREAVAAVFRSWGNPRAREYRRVNGIPENLGTGVNVQTMVYGNRGVGSGSGVAFTRDPATGVPRPYGEFLEDAQGEDVVAGIRDPIPLEAFADRFPGPARDLEEVRATLERHYKDMQDLEFTVDRGELFVLQTRTGKRTGLAAVKIATDMVDEGLIDRDTALLRVEADSLEQILHPMVDPEADVRELGRGLPASPGAAVGRAVFTSDEARRRAADGEKVVLVRTETSADDFPGMVAAEGILTSRGGMTSHAAVVARGMGKCCVAGASNLRIDEDAGTLVAGMIEVREGDWLTLDGTLGRVLLGQVRTVSPRPGVEFARLLGWADQVRRLRVRANADTPEDAVRARKLGAEGIGLCRTEHMFFAEDRLQTVREMILAAGPEERRSALDRLLPMQQGDFEGIFRAMDGLPVTIRLLDPPLHEFLPRGAEEIEEFSKRTGRKVEDVLSSVECHREDNPMLGHRGVRLAITIPELAEMQVRAIFGAALKVAGDGVRVEPEIMIPVVMTYRELVAQREIVVRVSEEMFAAHGRRIDFQVGTMIELPRAALTAAAFAPHADFFSFGTNDLTQTTLGLSRDDAGTFLPQYLEGGYLPADPFRSIDTEGVGHLVRTAVQEGRAAKKDLGLGVCGEHGGDPRSIEFFHDVGLDYVSCSTFRVPVARLAAAQVALRHKPPRERELAAPPAPPELVGAAG